MGKKNDLLSAVISDNTIDRIEHLVKYLSYRVFGQAIYRHVIFKICEQPINMLRRIIFRV